MPTRRQFMRQAIVSSVTVCSPAAQAMLAGFGRTSEAGSCDGDAEGPYQFFRVLFDNTSVEGAAFEAEAAARGAITRGVGVDLGGVWMHELEPQWRYRPAAIAGLTSGPHLFCLELLGRDYGMGVVYTVRHEIGAGDNCRHVISGSDPIGLGLWARDYGIGRLYSMRQELAQSDHGRRGPTILSWADLRAGTEHDWAGRAAALAMDCPSSLGPCRDFDLVDLASCSSLDRTLFSWVIAPVNGAPGLRMRPS